MDDIAPQKSISRTDAAKYSTVGVVYKASHSEDVHSAMAHACAILMRVSNCIHYNGGPMLDAPGETSMTVALTHA